MHKRELLLMPNETFELRAAGDGQDGTLGTVVGYPSLFDVQATIYEGPGYRFIEEVDPGAFTKTLAEDDIRATVNHNPDKLLGRMKAGTARFWADKKGLRMEVDVPNTTYGRDLVVSLERGDITGGSIWFSVVRDKKKEVDDVTVRRILEARLFEAGPVAFPAFEETEVALRSTIREIEAWRAEQRESWQVEVEHGLLEADLLALE